MVLQRSWGTGVGVVLALGACLGAAGRAQNNQAPAEVRAKLEQVVKRDPSAYVSCDVELSIGPLGAGKTTIEAWARDRRHYRVEEAHNSVVVVTPKEMKLYNALDREMLRVPAETVPGLEPAQRDLLALLGLATPEATAALLEEFSGELTPAGETTVGGTPCLAFSAGPRLRQMATDLVNLCCYGGVTVDVTLFDLFLERETALPHGMHLDASLTAFPGGVSLTMDVTTRKMDLDVQVPDDMLALDPPAETTDIIEWTPDTPTDSVSAFLSGLVLSIVRRDGNFEP